MSMGEWISKPDKAVSCSRYLQGEVTYDATTWLSAYLIVPTSFRIEDMKWRTNPWACGSAGNLCRLIRKQ